MRLVIPDPALVLLVGPSGAGKSTFAQAHFRPTEIVSSDAMRAMLADNPGDQGASAEAFHILSILVAGRLKRSLTTVVDATNLRAANRKRYRKLADRYELPTVAIAFDLPARLYLARNSQRAERVVEDSVISEQAARMGQALAELPGEGYSALYVLREPETLGRITVERRQVG